MDKNNPIFGDYNIILDIDHLNISNKRAIIFTCDAGATELGRLDENGYLEISGEITAAGMTKVEAGSTTAQSLTNSDYTTIIFEVEHGDILGEYDNTTGIFTASKSGTYIVSWKVDTAIVSWTGLKYFVASLSKNNLTTEGNFWDGSLWMAQAAILGRGISAGSVIITLAAEDTLRIKCYHTFGTAIDSVDVENRAYFHIARIA